MNSYANRPSMRALTGMETLSTSLLVSLKGYYLLNGFNAPCVNNQLKASYIETIRTNNRNILDIELNYSQSNGTC